MFARGFKYVELSNDHRKAVLDSPAGKHVHRGIAVSHEYVHVQVFAATNVRE